MCQKFRETRSRPKTPTTSKVENFVIIVNGFQPFTIITKSSTCVVAAGLDPPLETMKNIETITTSIRVFVISESPRPSQVSTGP